MTASDDELPPMESAPQKTSPARPAQLEGFDKLMGTDIQLCILTNKDTTSPTVEVGDLVSVSFIPIPTPATPAPLPDVKPSLYTIGDADLPPCLELSIRNMISTQTAICHAEGRFAQQPTATSFYIHLHSTIHLADLTIPNRIGKALAKKLLGNTQFKEGHYKQALKLYGAAAECAVAVVNEGDFTGVARKVAVDCTNNIARVHVKNGAFAKAKECCVECLKLDGGNVSALVIAANVCAEMGDFGEAAASLKAANDECAKEANKDHRLSVSKCEQTVRRKKLAYKEKEKAMSMKMMAPAEKKSASSESASSESASSESASSAPAFAPAATFAGRRAGMVFKKGALGVGYYSDCLDYADLPAAGTGAALSSAGLLPNANWLAVCAIAMIVAAWFVNMRFPQTN